MSTFHSAVGAVGPWLIPTMPWWGTFIPLLGWLGHGWSQLPHSTGAWRVPMACLALDIENECERQALDILILFSKHWHCRGHASRPMVVRNAGASTRLMATGIRPPNQSPTALEQKKNVSFVVIYVKSREFRMNHKHYELSHVNK